MPYTDAEYLDFDPQADECEVRVLSKKIVTTRKPHECIGIEPHEIPAGTRARAESAIVDGVMESTWCCLACIDAYFKAAN